MKIGKVIRPVRNTGEETTPPESQTSEEKRKNGSDKKGSNSSRKGSNDTSLHMATTTNPTSRKHLGSTTEGLEDTLRHTTLNGFTGENWTDRSHICDDSIQKKSAHYKKGPLIGKGSSGEVYECLNLNTGELVAIKEIKLYGEIEKMQPTITALLKENVQFRMLNHQNIIKYYETEILEAKDQSHLLIDIALEYVSGGSIKVLVDKFNNLEEKVVSSYTRQILEGLSYLHRNNIVHRNLKATNILIDASGTIKLSDFGTLRFDRFSEENPQGDNKNSPLKHPVYWLAPEVVMKKALGKPADIWSVGCVALEMLTGSPPWKGLAKNNDELARLITSGTHPNFPSDISEACRDFLMKTLKFKPEDRPTAADLLEHPFIISMSPNNSYLEADTIQSSVIGRPTEYFRNNSNQFFNFKNNDVRVQNFVSNMSTSNLNVSRFLSRGLSNDVVLARLGSTEIVPLTKSEVEEKDDEDKKSSAKASSLIKVQEVSCEDEYTPSATDRQFFPTRPRHVWEQKALSFEEKDKEKTEEQDIEKIKAEKRRQLEEEMMRELNQASTDRINEALEQEEDEEHSRDYSPGKPVVENYSNSQNSQMLNINSRLHVPVKNPLFTGISFSDFKRSGSNDDNSHPEAMVEASPMVGEDEIAAKFDNLRPDDLGVYWTWDGENEKEENEIETAKEVKSEKLQESERNSEMGEADNHVAQFSDQYDDMWTPEFQRQESVKNSNRLIKSDLERFRKAQKKLTERGHTQELEEIEEDNNKKNNNNEAQMLEVGEGEGTIYRKQTSLRSEFDLPYSDEIQSRGMRSIEGSQIIMRAVKEAEAVIEASPGFKDLEGDDYHSSGDVEA